MLYACRHCNGKGYTTWRDWRFRKQHTPCDKCKGDGHFVLWCGMCEACPMCVGTRINMEVCDGCGGDGKGSAYGAYGMIGPSPCPICRGKGRMRVYCNNCAHPLREARWVDWSPLMAMK